MWQQLGCVVAGVIVATTVQANRTARADMPRRPTAYERALDEACRTGNDPMHILRYAKPNACANRAPMTDIELEMQEQMRRFERRERTRERSQGAMR